MKFTIQLILILSLFGSCKKDTDRNPDPVSNSENYSSINDFFIRNNPAMQTYTVLGTAGGTIITPKGTSINIPPNAFVDPSNNVTETGTITIRFKDFYKKSDMLLANVPTTMANGFPLRSGGEFFIKAQNANGDVLDLAPGVGIEINQPFPGPFPLPLDTTMQAFVGARDSLNGMTWEQTFSNQVSTLAGTYVYSMYQFSSPLDSGSWCNSDDPTFFSGFPLTTLHISTDSIDQYQTQVFLLFSGINSMIHVYEDYLSNSFIYTYAPVGFNCTIVAIGERNGDLYSAFEPVTISNGTFANVTLSKTTTEEFKARLDSLN